eukprot:44032_1
MVSSKDMQCHLVTIVFILILVSKQITCANDANIDSVIFPDFTRELLSSSLALELYHLEENHDTESMNSWHSLDHEPESSDEKLDDEILQGEYVDQPDIWHTSLDYGDTTALVNGYIRRLGPLNMGIPGKGSIDKIISDKVHIKLGLFTILFSNRKFGPEMDTIAGQLYYFECYPTRILERSKNTLTIPDLFFGGNHLSATVGAWDDTTSYITYERGQTHLPNFKVSANLEVELGVLPTWKFSGMKNEDISMLVRNESKPGEYIRLKCTENTSIKVILEIFTFKAK